MACAPGRPHWLRVLFLYLVVRFCVDLVAWAFIFLPISLPGPVGNSGSPTGPAGNSGSPAEDIDAGELGLPARPSMPADLTKPRSGSRPLFYDIVEDVDASELGLTRVAPGVSGRRPDG